MRSAFVSSLLALLFAAQPGLAADEPAKDDKASADKPKDEKAADPAPAPPATPTGDTPAPTSASTAAIDAGASGSADATAGLSASADATPPSLEHPVERAPGAVRCSAEPLAAGDHPEYKDRNCYEGRLESKHVYLYGGIEIDAGYAKYTYQNKPQRPYEQFNDLRGRFVFGPMIHHEFGDSGYYVAATGQLVGWMRDREKANYQINVDDVYAKVGGPAGSGHWDFQLGRFMTWRVYHKGLGFDLYTLEDNGANVTGTVASGGAQYAVHTYEVSYLYYRQGNLPYGGEEIAGKAALHYFPTAYLGFELAGVYGQAGGGQANSLGGRFAADFHKQLGPVGVRVSAGAEDRYQRLAAPQVNNISTDPANPNYQECPDCLMQDNKGVGGSAILKVSIVELGAGWAKGWDLDHKNPTTTVGASRNLAQSGERQSYGGYLQVDPGSLVIKRPLIVGLGLQHSEVVLKTDNYQNHVQGAAYVAFPLGFNDAMVKFVLSRAEAENYTRSSAEGAPLEFDETDSAVTTGRLRFSYGF